MTVRGASPRRLLRTGLVGLSGLALAVSPTLVATAAPPAGAPSSPSAGSGAGPRTQAPAPEAAVAVPRLRVRTVEAGLEIPWDLTFLPNGGMLYTEREKRRVVYRAPGGARRVVVDAPVHVWASGETGMMDVLADPRFRRTRTFLTCHGSTAGGSPDVRVVRWRLSKSFRRARVVEDVVTGLPATSGRHGGCRLAFGSEGALYIGTGDAADPANPQSLTSGGGKVLRVRPGNGRGWSANRWSDARNAMKRRVFTYGHRNVQGLALRADGRMWSVEHGTYRDDEANLLRNGGNYGWQPGPGYDESRPMTDHSLPGRQLDARWSSGDPTIAPSGAAWLRGKKWGAWQGCLAIAVLAGEELLILRFDRAGRLRRTFHPAVLDGDAGRLRSAVLGPDNNLYLTTSNGSDDRILKVVPRR
jgi:glucose/arabinose dehydrogenase